MESVLVQAGKSWMGAVGDWQFLLVVQGESMCASMQPSVPLYGGDVLVSHPAGRLLLVNHSPGELRTRVLTVNPAYMRVLITERRRQAMDRMKDRHQGQRLLSPSLPSTGAMVRALLSAIPGSPELHGVVVRAVNSLVEQLPVGDGDSTDPMDDARARLREIIQALRPTDCQDLSVWALAQECECSPRQVNGLLREEYGCTLVELKNSVRLRRAEDLLLRSRFPIGRVAVAAGFANNGVFSSLFQRKHGMSPSSWRLRASQVFQ